MFLSLALSAFGLLLPCCLGVPAETRIVNGTDAIEGQIKYIVSLRYRHAHNCGGSILDAWHILTAAHCVKSFKLKSLSIQYGQLDLKSASNIIQVANVSYNQNYVPGYGFKNDVAVVKLESPITFDEDVQPIRLPRANESTPENKLATLSGWGTPYSGGSVMDHLQVVTIRIYSDEECEKIHEITGPTDRNFNICAGVPEGGKGQCNGDSGGPLVVDGVQVGIVSWSVKPCTAPGYPGVFTKVSTQVDWIHEQLEST